MKILLFVVSNVGKTTLGSMLAKRLGYNFYGLDEDVKRAFGRVCAHGKFTRERSKKR